MRKTILPGLVMVLLNTLAMTQTPLRCTDVISDPDQKPHLPLYQDKNAYDQWYFTQQDLIRSMHEKLGPLDTTYDNGKLAHLDLIIDQEGQLDGLFLRDEQYDAYLPLFREAITELLPLQPAQKDGNSICSKLSILVPLTHWVDTASGEEVTITPYQPPLYLADACADLSGEEQKACSQKAMMTKVNTRVRYPPRAIAKGTEGTAVIRFMINKEGQASGHYIFQDVDHGCGEAALQAVLPLTQWAPGRNEHGEAINVMATLPIRFKLVGP